MSEDGGGRRGRSRGLNRVQIIGNLGRDPELRFTQDGTPVANFTVAVNESWRSRDGEQHERTEWFRIVAWRHLAEIANQYLRRGRQVFVEGSLQTSEWQDREGNSRTSTELVARNMIMLGGRQDDADGPPRDDDGGGGRREQRGETPASGRPEADDTVTADDLPF